MKQQTAEKVIADLQEHAERIKRGEPQTVGTMSIGDSGRQGDIYLTRIARVPASAKPVRSTQLAPSTSQGSRHEVPSGIAAYTADPREVAALIRQANPQALPDIERFIGPVVIFERDAPVMHPEHGWLNMPAGTVCAVTYQRDLDEEERERRVQD